MLLSHPPAPTHGLASRSALALPRPQHASALRTYLLTLLTYLGAVIAHKIMDYSVASYAERAMRLDSTVDPFRCQSCARAWGWRHPTGSAASVATSPLQAVPNLRQLGCCEKVYVDPGLVGGGSSVARCLTDWESLQQMELYHAKLLRVRDMPTH